MFRVEVPVGSAAPHLTPRAVTVHNTEADEQASSLALLDQHYEQLSCGMFAGSVSSISHAGISLFRESLQQSVFQTGSATPHQITVAAACELSGDAYWNGRQLQSADAVVVFVPRSQFELRTPRQSVCVGVSIPDEVLAGFDTERSVLTWHELLRANDCWTDRRSPELRLSSRIAHLFESVSDPAAVERADFEQAVDDILEDLGRRLGMEPEGGRRLRSDSYPRIARKARAAMLDQLGAPLDVASLCAQLGCSRRALQYAFQNVFGIKPVAYFRSLRLAAARRALLSPHRTATVQGVAAQFGFGHLPRFAQDYANMFNQLPSQSLARGRWLPSR